MAEALRVKMCIFVSEGIGSQAPQMRDTIYFFLLSAALLITQKWVMMILKELLKGKLKGFFYVLKSHSNHL